MKVKIKILLLLLLMSACSQEEMNEALRRQALLELETGRLEALCKAMNEDLLALKVVITAPESGDYIIKVEELANGSGYVIDFLKTGPITIRHGEKGSTGPDGEAGKDGQDGEDGKDGQNGQDGQDGEDGKDGQNGQDGQDGEDGKDGQNGADGIPGQPGTPGTPGDKGEAGKAPVVTVKQDTDGDWYWAILNTADHTTTFLLDTDNQKVKARGDDGGVPVIAVNAAGNWTVDYGTGAVELKDATGKPIPATGKDGDPLFQNIGRQDGYVQFTLADGTALKVAEWTGATVGIEADTLLLFRRSEVKTVSFVCDPADRALTPYCTSLSGWQFEVAYTSATTGNIKITAPAPDETAPALSGKVKLIVPDNEGNRETSLNVTLLYEYEMPDFSRSFIYEVFFEGLKVGELCREYVPAYSLAAGKSATVFYPFNVYNQVFADGFVFENGSVINYKDCRYTAHADPAYNRLFTEDGITFFTGAYLGYPVGSGSGLSPYLVRDNEGNVYKTMKIGTQYWMAENLRTLTDPAAFGGKLAAAIPDSQWKAGKPGAAVYGCADGTDAGSRPVREKYGVLYNYGGARGELAPDGWKIPDHGNDWTTLQNYLGKTTLAKALKIAGFTEQLGGTRNSDGVYEKKDEVGYWRFGNAPVGNLCWVFYVDPLQVDFPEDIPDPEQLNNEQKSQNFGFSIRCIRK